MHQLDTLVDRLEAGGADPLARVLSAALRERLDRLLAETRAQEERALLPDLSRRTDAGTRGQADRLRVDLGWLAANWHELRPQVDGVAGGQSWVDLDALRDGAELFAALVREHVAFASSVAGREAPARHAGRDAVAAH